MTGCPLELNLTVGLRSLNNKNWFDFQAAGADCAPFTVLSTKVGAVHLVSAVGDLIHFAIADVLVPLFNAIVKNKGLPLPNIGGVNCVGPKLALLKDTIQFTTDVSYNP